jgi:hypothetical protein
LFVDVYLGEHGLAGTSTVRVNAHFKLIIVWRDRETERQRDRETERQRDREAERQRGREAERQRGREAERQRDRNKNKQIDRQSYMCTERWTDRQNKPTCI